MSRDERETTVPETTGASVESQAVKSDGKKDWQSDTLKGVVSTALLLIGFLVLFLAAVVGAGGLPAMRDGIGELIAIVLGTSSRVSPQDASGLLILISVGLIAAGSVFAARAVLTGVAKIVPSMGSGIGMNSVVGALGVDVSETMIKAGVMGRPLDLVRRFAVFSVAAAVVSIPTSAVAAFVFNQPLILIFNAVPFTLLFYPSLSIKSKVGDTVRGVDEELPYFAIVAAILQSAGLTLYSALTKVSDAKLFKRIEYEGLLIARESTFFGKTQIGAIVERGAQHPSEKFRTYLQGYTSILASGGDAAGYLEEKAKDLIYWTEFRWRSYAQSASDLGEAIIAIFFTLPLIVIAGAFVSPGDTSALLVGTIVVIVPILAVLEYSAILRIQPKTYDEIDGWILPGIAGGVGAFALAYFFREPAWLEVAAGLVGVTFVYGWSTYWQLRDVRRCEDALPQFMRDVTEYKKIGYDVTKAIRRLADERKYNKAFDRVLKDIATQVKLGSTMDEVVVKSKSWLTKMVFYILGEVVETGGGTPTLLETVTEFTQRIVGVRRETKSAMRIYGLLAYATPIGLAMVIITMYYMLQQFGGILSGNASLGVLSGATALPANVLDLTKVLVVEAAAVVGLLAGKTIDFTGKNSFRIAVGVLAAVASVIVVEIAVPALGILTT